MTKKFFITGTDTDAGKTIVTGGLAALCIRKGLKTAVVKPVQTGTESYAPDLDIVEKMAPGLEELPEELKTPYSFPFPASPHLAAEMEGVVIEKEKILSAFKGAVDYANPDILLAEGAGGLMVPIHDDYMMINLMKDMEIPVILVSRAGLGTLNHTLLSIAALKNYNIQIAGVIVNKISPFPSEIELDNLKILEKLTDVPVLATVKESPSPDTGDSVMNDLDTAGINKLI